MADFVKSIEAAVASSGLTDGKRISFHHHLRLGDRVVEAVLPVLERLGFRNLTLCVSSVMGSACVAVLAAVRSGVITRIETTGMKEPLSSAVLRGEIPHPAIFRTHGGRARAIEAGETPIDVAFIAASAVDGAGNANGVDGPNRFGSMGYALVDAAYARHVVVVTDYVSANPLNHVSISADQVNQIVAVDSIGEKTLLSGGSLRTSNRPVEQVIAHNAMAVLTAAGVIRNGFAFQAGSGGISLLVSRMTADYMRENSIQGGFASGGATGTLVAMLEEGLFSMLYDVQSFDDAAAASLGRNPAHREMSASEYASPDRPDCIASRLDVMVLSATEVDQEFNVNSITGTDGRILGALGGAPDTAEGARLTMVVLPTVRGIFQTLHRHVRTVCTPGSSVDVLVTERGICVNPARGDVQKALFDGGVDTTTVGGLMGQVYDNAGEPDHGETGAQGSRTVAVVESRYGGVLDTIHSAVLEANG